MQINDDNLIFTVTICAVIFGTDETLLSVSLGKGFIFRRMSLMPLKDHLDLIFETDAMGLRRDYETSRIDETLDVICAYKSYTINLDRTEAKEYYRKMCDDVLEYLDDSIRAIRLFIEGSIRFNRLSIKMESETTHISRTDMSSNFSNIISISEAMGTNTICKFHCDDEKIYELNNNISLAKFPLSDMLLNNCHRYYDLSYHQDNFISITLLITCLEILFINDKNAIKEKLAKRCSVFLFDSKNERLSCFNKFLEAYKKRSSFVHSGDCLKINDEDILFLRGCVRKSLIKYINNKYNKIDVIKNLKTTIENLDYWGNMSK